VDAREDERRHRLAADPPALGLLERLVDQVVDVDAGLRRARDEYAAAAELPVEAREVHGFIRGLDSLRHRWPTCGVVEPRHRVGLPAEHGNAESLQHLRRGLHVEQRLHARADDDQLRAGELEQVG
jgi:hypothetical protein